MKKHYKKILVLALLILGAIWYPTGVYIDNAWEKSDRAIYEAQKDAYDRIQDAKVDSIKYAMFDEWAATHDTTLRTIREVRKKPEFSEKGYDRKTGKMICKERLKTKDMVCEPETEFVVTGYYVSGYSSDTVWTPGYRTRDEWMTEGLAYAREESERHRVELEYTGHSASFEKMFETAGLLCTVIFGACAFIMLYVLYGLFKDRDLIEYLDRSDRKKP